MKYIKILAYFLVFTLLVSGASAYAQDGQWFETNESRLRLLVADTKQVDDKKVYKGLAQLEFNDGWYSYWQFAGDAGIPLSIAPQENSGIESVKINWPVPHRSEAYGLMSFVYKEKVDLPLQIEVKEDFASNDAYDGRVKAFYMVCKQVCVPQEFIVEIPRFDTLDKPYVGQNQALLRLAERRLPREGNVSGLEVNTAVVANDALVLAVKTNSGFDDLDVFIDGGEAAVFTAKPEISIQEHDETTAMVKIKSASGTTDLAEMLSGKSLHVVVKSRNKAIQRDFSF